MAAIESRTNAAGKTTYRVKVRLKGHPTQTASFPRKTDAKRWAQDTESAIREGRHFKTTEAKKHTLAELVERYSRDVLPAKKDGKHQAAQLAWWRQELGALALADCTPARIAEARDKLSAERGPATVNRYLAALSHAFTLAVKEWGWLEFNPLQRVSKPKEPRGRVRFLSDDERGRLLEACKQSANPDLFPAVVLALSTGARQAEIMGLEWKRIDLARGVAVLDDTKNGERRALPLAGLALELLKERAKVRRIDTPLLFPGRNPSKPVELRKAWLAALAAAGVEDFRWHDLRHSAASYLAMNGASLAEIAEVLGHKTLSMVKRYSHLSDSHTAGVVASMNAKIFGEG